MIYSFFVGNKKRIEYQERIERAVLLARMKGRRLIYETKRKALEEEFNTLMGFCKEGDIIIFLRRDYLVKSNEEIREISIRRKIRVDIISTVEIYPCIEKYIEPAPRTVSLEGKKKKKKVIPQNIKKTTFKECEGEIMGDIKKGSTYREICEKYGWVLSSFRSYMSRKKKKKDVIW